MSFKGELVWEKFPSRDQGSNCCRGDSALSSSPRPVRCFQSGDFLTPA